MLPWNYGLGARHRIEDVFEANIKHMFAETLPPRGVKHEECGFVQMIVSNQAYAGKGYASALLTHQLEQHFAEFPKAPVVLDTTTVSAIRVYERLGFELLAEKPVDTGTDARGILLKKDADEATREAARKMCIQRIMIKMPPF
jgi:GNAT superfamily N-acetyltransferase